MIVISLGSLTSRVVGLDGVHQIKRGWDLFSLALACENDVALVVGST